MIRLLTAMMILLGSSLPAEAQIRGAQPFGYVSGETFLSYPRARREDYIAGLADQLVSLYQAQLVDGFRWFENCVRRRNPADMSRMLVDFLNENDARKPEPASNNFIWAAAKGCTPPARR